MTAVAISSLCAQEKNVPEPGKLTSLRQAWIDAKEKKSRPIKDKYLTALIGLRKKLTRQGKLEEAVLVQDEIAALGEGRPRVETDEGKSAGTRELNSLRTTFVREMARMNQSLDNKYVAALKEMQQAFTKKEALEPALAVQAEINRVAAPDDAEGGWQALKGTKPVAIAPGRDPFLKLYQSNESRLIDKKQVPPSEFIFAHAPSKITYSFEEPISQFRATMALVDGVNPAANVIFKIGTDKGIVYTSKPVTAATKTHKEIALRFDATTTLILITDPNGRDYWDHAIWLRPEVR